MLDFKQDILKKNYIFFIGFFLFVFAGLALTQYYGRDQFHLLTNSYFSPFWDVFFKYLSKFGPIVFILSILFYVIKKGNYKVLFVLLSAYLSNFIVLTFVKRSFFIHVHRPTYYFSQKGIDLHLIDGVRSQIPFTFPSGHAAESFLFMLFVCIITKSKWIQFIAIVISIFMAFSRVYLSKHFLIDTIGGGFLGVFIMILTYYIFQNKSSGFLEKKILK